MIANGLPRQTALAGLTITPARLLGLQKQIGAIEPGMIANLTVIYMFNVINKNSPFRREVVARDEALVHAQNPGAFIAHAPPEAA